MIALVFCYVSSLFDVYILCCMRLNNNRMLKLKCERWTRSMCAIYFIIEYIAICSWRILCIANVRTRNSSIPTNNAIKQDERSFEELSVRSGASVWPAVFTRFSERCTKKYCFLVALNFHSQRKNQSICQPMKCIVYTQRQKAISIGIHKYTHQPLPSAHSTFQRCAIF